jgi:hypothetical protein
MYDIVYKPRTTIKAHTLNDFVAEWTKTQTPPKEKELEYWTINFDGTLQLQGAGAGLLVTSSKRESFIYVLQMHFPASNNVVEYEALLLGLRVTTASAYANSKFSRTHCSWSTRPTKSGHVWTKSAIILPGAPQIRKQFRRS